MEHQDHFTVTLGKQVHGAVQLTGSGKAEQKMFPGG